MKKHIISVLISMSVVAVLLAGCGNEDVVDEPVVETQVEEVVEQVEEEQPVETVEEPVEVIEETTEEPVAEETEQVEETVDIPTGAGVRYKNFIATTENTVYPLFEGICPYTYDDAADLATVEPLHYEKYNNDTRPSADDFTDSTFAIKGVDSFTGEAIDADLFTLLRKEAPANFDIVAGELPYGDEWRVLDNNAVNINGFTADNAGIDLYNALVDLLGVPQYYGLGLESNDHFLYVDWIMDNNANVHLVIVDNYVDFCVYNE